MRAVVPGTELFDRQVVDADQLEPFVHEILRAVRSQESVILRELPGREQRGVPRAEQNALVIAQVELAELRLPYRTYVVTQAHEQGPPRQFFEGDEVDWLAIHEEMARGIDVGAGMRAKIDRRDIRARSGGDGLLQGDVYRRVAGIHEAARADGDGYIVDAARQAGQEGRLVDSLALRVKRGISASKDAPFCRRNP